MADSRTRAFAWDASRKVALALRGNGDQTYIATPPA
jgi:hypothetical protein